MYAETAGAVRRSPMEDSVSVALRFRSGALGTFFLSDAAPSPWTWEQGTGESPLFPWSGQNSMRFMGDRASLEFPNLRLWRCAADHGDWTRRPQPEDIPVRAGDAFMLQLEHFCAVLRGETTPLLSVEDAIGTLRAVLAVARAAATGERQGTADS